MHSAGAYAAAAPAPARRVTSAPADTSPRPIVGGGAGSARRHNPVISRAAPPPGSAVRATDAIIRRAAPAAPAPLTQLARSADRVKPVHGRRSANGPGACARGAQGEGEPEEEGGTARRAAGWGGAIFSRVCMRSSRCPCFVYLAREASGPGRRSSL